MNTGKNIQKSHGESFRGQYLFLGLYLDLKSGYLSRLNNITRGEEKDNSHYFAFENMVKHIKEKIEIEKNNDSSKVSIRTFENAFKRFCENYQQLLKSPNLNSTVELPDYLLNCYHESNFSRAWYIKQFENMFVEHPNPFTDVNFVEFVQLLRINYELTGNEKLKNYLIQQMKRMLFSQSNIRKPRKTQKSNDPDDDYFTLRWPKETIFNDQAAFIWTLKYLEENKDKKSTVDILAFEYSEMMSKNENEKIYYESFYSVFRREIYPVYFWFARIYFGDTIPKNFPDVLKWNQILFWTINKLISEIAFVLGNYIGKEKNVNPEIVNKYGLNNRKGLKIDKIGFWGLLDIIPRLKFNNKSRPFYTNIRK